MISRVFVLTGTAEGVRSVLAVFHGQDDAYGWKDMLKQTCPNDLNGDEIEYEVEMFFVDAGSIGAWVATYKDDE